MKWITIIIIIVSCVFHTNLSFKQFVCKQSVQPIGVNALVLNQLVFQGLILLACLVYKQYSSGKVILVASSNR